METARYVFAFLTVGSVPFAVSYWYAIHPFVGFWRRRGPVLTYVAMATLLAINLGAAWVYRGPLFAVSYPTGPLHWGVAAALYLTALVIELQCRRHLKFATLAGLPELSPPDDGPGELLQEGIYARVRHPRYISVGFGVLAAAVFCNYLSLWIITILLFPALFGIVLFEERELVDRFGSAYIDYARRVPRFFPRRG